MTTHHDSINKPYGVLPVPSLSPQLLGLVKTGKVYDLSFPISAETPYAGTTSPYSMRMNQRHRTLLSSPRLMALCSQFATATARTRPDRRSPAR